MGDSDLALYTMMRYHMGWVDEHGKPQKLEEGKRIRSLLCLVSCNALGGDYAQGLPAAAAVELTHNFSLIHDDIQDGSPQRRHRSAVWWVWGPAQAINTGDAMHALARLSLLKLIDRGVSPERAMAAAMLLDQSCLNLCEGQYLDLSYQDRLDVDISSYNRMVELKTGALMSCAMEMGAIVATDDMTVRSAFARAGMKLGMALQVQNDLADLREDSQDEGRLEDILNRKKSLPVVYAFQQAQGQDKRELLSLYSRRNLHFQDLERVRAILERLGAREYCQEVAEAYSRQALEELAGSPITPTGMREIKEIAGFLVQGLGSSI